MTDELRTAAIEAAHREAHAAGARELRRYATEAGVDIMKAGIAAELVVEAVWPLIVAGTASQIADAIEAEANRKPKGIREHLARDSFLTSREWLSYAASIARRVGETS
jgi:hypothetical protein